MWGSISIRRQHLVLAALVALASFSVLASSHVGLNGHHVWRQSDVLAQIQGFYGGKFHDPFRSYLGGRVFFDTPIYQYCIAKLAVLLDGDPLVVTRYFNVACLLLFLLCGHAFAEGRAAGGGLVFAFLAVTSPLLQHYFSVPLPDILALALSMAGLLLLRIRRPWGVLAGSLALMVAALIKSPVPFVFLAYYGLASLRFEAAGGLRRGWLALLAPFALGLAGALAAEKIRATFLGADAGALMLQPDWYFGTLAQRLSPAFWGKLHVRLMDSFAFHALGYAALSLPVLELLVSRGKSWFRVLPYAGAFLSGWLVFSNVYYIHDYYELPVVALAFLGVAEGAGLLLARRGGGAWAEGPSPRAAWALAALVVGLAGATVVHMAKIGAPRAVSVAESLRYSLRSTERFVFVSDDARENPAMGGLTNTRFTRIPKAKLESACEEILAQGAPVLVVGSSACLESHKAQARSYMDDNGLVFFMPRELPDPAPASAELDRERTAELAAAFTTDDPSDYTSQVRLTEAGIRLFAQDLEMGVAVFDLRGRFGPATLVLRRLCRPSEARPSHAPVSLGVKLDGGPPEVVDLPPNGRVALRLDLTGVELLKLRFNGVARTPYDDFLLHVE